MKTNRIIETLILLVLQPLFISSCSDKVEIPDFSVIPISATVKVGEPVIFDISGNPDIISFYSGEKGNAYEFHNQDRTYVPEMYLSFLTYITSGAGNPMFAEIMYSSDFSGNYSESDVRTARWNSISDRFIFPEAVGDRTDSGQAKIDDIFEDTESPVYFAFYYKANKYNESEGNERTKVYLSDFMIQGIVDGQVSNLYDMSTAGFQIVAASNMDGLTGSNYPSIDTPPTQIRLQADFKPAEDRECWAVSGPIYKTDLINAGPDFSVPIKGMSDAPLDRYSFVYNSPGKYKATFIAKNAAISEKKEIVKEITITVVEDSGNISPVLPEEWL